MIKWSEYGQFVDAKTWESECGLYRIYKTPTELFMLWKKHSKHPRYRHRHKSTHGTLQDAKAAAERLGE
jgi:hypothetical protein